MNNGSWIEVPGISSYMSTELTLSALLILYPLTVFYVVVAARFLSMNAAVFLELLVVMSPA